MDIVAHLIDQGVYLEVRKSFPNMTLKKFSDKVNDIMALRATEPNMPVEEIIREIKSSFEIC